MAVMSFSGSAKNTKSSDKPNEDVFLCDDANHIYIIADGVSRDKINGTYPNPSPALTVSQLFVSIVHKAILNEIYSGSAFNYEEIIRKSISIGNDAVRKFNLSNYCGYFPPGTVGIVTIIAYKKLYYAYIGDCYGRIITPTKTVLFTECQTAKLAKSKIHYSAEMIRSKICNNTEHPYGYGVINGEHCALDFVTSGSLDMPIPCRIILSTDGVESQIEGLNSQEMFYKSENNFIEESIKSEIENADDRTIIIISEME